jgi:hypothetical protein
LEDLDVDGNVIKIQLEETGCDGVDWIHLAQNRGQRREGGDVWTWK